MRKRDWWLIVREKRYGGRREDCVYTSHVRKIQTCMCPRHHPHLAGPLCPHTAHPLLLTLFLLLFCSSPYPSPLLCMLPPPHSPHLGSFQECICLSTAETFVGTFSITFRFTVYLSILKILHCALFGSSFSLCASSFITKVIKTYRNMFIFPPSGQCYAWTYLTTNQKPLCKPCKWLRAA